MKMFFDDKTFERELGLELASGLGLENSKLNFINLNLNLLLKLKITLN